LGSATSSSYIRYIFYYRRLFPVKARFSIRCSMFCWIIRLEGDGLYRLRKNTINEGYGLQPVKGMGFSPYVDRTEILGL
jgi:hypothetical protein